MARREPKPVFESFLVRQGYALFERAPDGSFRAMGEWPDWCEQIWGSGGASHTFRFAEKSPFLENFFEDAEEVWTRGEKDFLRSGNWIERAADGREIPLEACALKLAGKSVLALQNLSGTFADQQQLYQTARDSLLEHERLMREIQKKEILLHCIVHDLSQPLGAMRGCFDLLADENLSGRTARFVEIARGESVRQEQMIRGILEAFSADLAAQESAADKEAEPVGLAECAARVVRDFSTAFELRGIHLRLHPSLDASRDWKTAGDESRVLRIFGNLLENAQRYTPRGKSVTVGLEDKGACVLAFVDDEGPGLPSETSAAGGPAGAGGGGKSDAAAAGRLFALFAKGKDRPGKAGLGLYFCKITVERWGGSIGAENRPQGGARFWFRLPRAAQSVAQKVSQQTVKRAGAEKTLAATRPAEDAHAERRARAGKAGATRTTKPMRILVAEDSEANRELLIELLKKRGHSVEGVADGREALHAAERGQFDILLVDEEMPHKNGIEVTRAIRAAETASGKHLTIVGVTGNATEEDEKRFLDAGMDAFLAKPVRMDRLFEVVESAARGEFARAALPSASPITHPPPASDAQAHSAVQPAPAADEDVVAHLRRSTGGNEPLMRSLAKTFLADAPQQIARLRRALAKKDAAQAGKTAHLLKGALSIFGASRAVEAARSLEAMGRSGDLRDAAAAFIALEEGFARLQQELHSLRGPHPKPKSIAKRKSSSGAVSKKSARPRSKR
jgi:signal transduction histidine kinase/CheY-like chemotaxis protein